ncbi:uncharacterized protein M421DRAFT_342453 [Didymella exigua CBS 183.55]|uniref:Zn(2)-C6 fungal-type domain-containing protein n=1 Tax=Didymella exigua CBS 183.55 TaxID=1150837 RepID=A0A6A5RUS2_9PLEO|nr:uncharacterized protein M421DRAFT_342453 [Didymella exigua CBS 183.55]KAF1931243.1 hypothetical protein M421DRAFT_342453 [Didymella exigua CBS 183.55]
MHPRRRLEVPPVKAACLACRASKARCNGQNPCNRCSVNGKVCKFIPSQRGRVVRAPVTPPSTHKSSESPASIEGPEGDGPYKRPRLSSGPRGPLHQRSGDGSTNIRIHTNGQALIDAYYLLIHPCYPVLPPPVATIADKEQAQSVQEPEFTRSPLAHAIAALVALVPKGTCRDRIARHDYAEHCSDLALRAIDWDMDAPEPLLRNRFHHDVPVHLESTIANFLVAVYEYNYRGSMMRARTRMASVITMAMDLGLHGINIDTTADSECKRRAWSMILFFANKLSIIHHLPPLMTIGDPRFKTPPPTLSIVPEPWEAILGAQDILLISQARPPSPKELEALDATVSTYIQNLDRPPTGREPIDAEGLAAHNWWAVGRIVVHSARIRLHRPSAFADIPAFVNKHCDMTALQDAKHFPIPTTNCHELPSPESLADSPKTNEWPDAEATGPFSARGSADICLKSAFIVLRMFRYLTEVLVDRHLQMPGTYGASEDERRAIKASVPITMPLMACSAMQACYVMIMTLYKVKFTLIADQTSEDSTLKSDLSFQDTERLVEELRHGVRDSLHMLQKYGTEFAHVGPMYEELKMVHQVAFLDV